MSIDFQGSDIDRAALVIMHYQVDVFDILFGKEPSPLLDRCNALIEAGAPLAGPCCSPTFRSAKSMNMRRRRRIAKSHRISRADDFAPVCPSKGLRSNGATFSMHVREPASFMARRSTPTFGRAA